MKHKHYDLIVAWANGAKIQYLSYNLECAELKRLGFGKDCETRIWLDCVNAPNWYTDFEYRIKPETNERIIDVLNERIIDVLKANIEQQAKEIDELRERLEEARQLYIKQLVICGELKKELALERLSIERELSDEEVDKILKQHDWYNKSWVDMVRSIESAILKKAREK